jgi:molybdenum cofactor biosynthesis enzyme MoaA
MRLPILDLPKPALPQLETGPRSISAVKVLRISITDRCNFRCLYCMPEEGVRWLPKENILTFEEIADVVRAAIDIHGIRRFKLTGGEPTVRHGLLDLVTLLRKIPGIDDLSLTTNGMLLETLAHPLHQAGLDRITVSIDSLRPDRFQRITRTGDLATVLRGLDACEDAGFTATKINCVTMRGTNDDEFTSFARLTFTRPLTVRYDANARMRSQVFRQCMTAAGWSEQPRNTGSTIAAPETDWTRGFDAAQAHGGDSQCVAPASGIADRDEWLLGCQSGQQAR